MRDAALLATFWTCAGPIRPVAGAEVSPWDIRERIAAAGRAGFRGFGFGHADLMAWSDRVGFDAIRLALDQHGMRRVEFESLFDWWAEGARRATSDAMRDDLLFAIERIGLSESHVKCGPDLQGGTWPVEVYARGLGDLADRAARVGARVGLESFPFADLSSPARSLAVVEAAGRDNAGLLVDVWHVMRGGVGLEAIRRLPGDRIVLVELNDADPVAVGPLAEDTVDRRRLCGEGAFDLRGFVSALDSAGYEGFYGVEILSREHRALPLDEAVRRAYASTVDACFA